MHVNSARLVGLGLSLGLAVTGSMAAIPTSSATATATAMSDAVVPSADPVPAPKGEPVEDMATRTETTSTFINPDGTRTRRDYGTPVRVRNNNGSWSDIDFNLVQRADGNYVPKVTATDTVVGGGGNAPAAQVTLDDGAQLDMTLPAELPEPTVEGGVATYKLDDTTDLVVTVVDGGVSTTFRLHKRPAPEERDFALRLINDGLKVAETATGGLQASDEQGERVGTGGAMVAWDARKDDAGDPLKIVPVEADLTTVAGAGFDKTQELSLSAPDALLDSPSTVYPVTVDPVLTSLTPARDTFVREGDTGNNGTSHSLQVGPESASNTKPAISLLQFDTTPLNGSDIIAADINLWQYYAQTCSARTVLLYPLDTSWDTYSTWSNKPATRANTGDTSFATQMYGGGAGCPSNWIKLDVRNMVQAWAAGTYPNRGLQLSIAGMYQNDLNYQRRFCSFNPNSSLTYCNSVAVKPHLDVTYNRPPGTPAAQPAIDTRDSTGTSSSATPTLSTPVTDPDGGTVSARFVLRNNSGGASVIVPGQQVQSGETSTAIVPAGALTLGGTYSVTASATDGALTSPESPAVDVRIDSQLSQETATKAAATYAPPNDKPEAVLPDGATNRSLWINFQRGVRSCMELHRFTYTPSLYPDTTHTSPSTTDGYGIAASIESPVPSTPAAAVTYFEGLAESDRDAYLMALRGSTDRSLGPVAHDGEVDAVQMGTAAETSGCEAVARRVIVEPATAAWPSLDAPGEEFYQDVYADANSAAARESWVACMNTRGFAVTDYTYPKNYLQSVGTGGEMSLADLGVLEDQTAAADIACRSSSGLQANFDGFVQSRWDETLDDSAPSTMRTIFTSASPPAIRELLNDASGKVAP